MNLVDKYFQIDSIPDGLTNSDFPVSYKPVPTEEEYTEGEIYRFFAIRRNSGEVTEVRDKNLLKLDISPLYDTVRILWYISGPSRNIMNGRTIQTQGVFEKNQKSIDENSKIYPELRDFLNNPLELYRGF